MNQADSTIDHQYLSFRLGDDLFVVDVNRAREVLDFIAPTRLPGSRDPVVGVINLRGKAIPVTDLRQRFGMEAAAATRESCILVLEVKTEEGEQVVGLVADGVEEVLHIPPAQVEPPPRFGSLLHRPFLRGLGHHQESLVLMIDLDQIFREDALDSIAAQVSANTAEELEMTSS